MRIHTIVPYRTIGTLKTVKCRQNSPYLKQSGYIAHTDTIVVLLQAVFGFLRADREVELC